MEVVDIKLIIEEVEVLMIKPINPTPQMNSTHINTFSLVLMGSISPYPTEIKVKMIQYIPVMY